MDKIKKKCKVVILTTNEFNNNTLCECIKENGLFTHALKIGQISRPPNTSELKSKTSLHRYFDPKHLYILSDDEIDVGDWRYDTVNKEVRQVAYGYPIKTSLKVIASTDESLGLPKPSPEFIKSYVKANGSITDVIVEYVSGVTYLQEGMEGEEIYVCYPKTNRENEISITKVKYSWNREEVSQLLYEALEAGFSFRKLHYFDFQVEGEKWIEENL